jgi:4-alpha-glucanotransferase
VEFRDPGSPAVQKFVREHRTQVDFMLWLQWIAEQQLAAAQALARESGMRIGLYRDLAGSRASGIESASSKHCGARN